MIQFIGIVTVEKAETIFVRQPALQIGNDGCLSDEPILSN